MRQDFQEAQARQALPLEPKSLVSRGSGVMHAPTDNIEI